MEENKYPPLKLELLRKIIIDLGAAVVYVRNEARTAKGMNVYRRMRLHESGDHIAIAKNRVAEAFDLIYSAREDTE